MRAARTPYLLAAAVLLWAFSSLAVEPLQGTWTASAQEDRLLLNLRVKQHGPMGLTLPRSAFQGLNTADGTDAEFQLVREAGTLHFEGRFVHGEGAGHYRFEPDATWREEMAELGYAKIPQDKLLQVAIFQVTPEHILDLKAAGYTRLTLDELVQTRIHRVTPEYIREIREAGYPEVTLEQLVRLRIHAIDTDYVRSLSRNKNPGRK